MRLELVQGGTVRGVIVCSFRDADDAYAYRRAFILDVVAPMDDPTILRQLLEAAGDGATARGADALLCAHTDARLTAALKAAGFRVRRPERHLLVRPGPVEGEARQALLDGEGWFVTQGDSDIDRPW